MRNLQLSGMALVAFAGAHYLQTEVLDPNFAARSRREVPDLVLRSPGERTLQIATFEHRLGAADLQWLDVVQRIGVATSSSTAPEWSHIAAGCDRVTDLDPLYEGVYDTCGIVLVTAAHRVGASNQILLKGEKRLPGAWRLPFMLGYNSFFEEGDPSRAAQYMAKAALNGAPPFVGSFAGRLRFASGDLSGALELLDNLIPNLEGRAKEDAIWRRDALRSEPKLARFDEACLRWQKDFGEVPETGLQLLEAGYVRELPQDEFGSPIVFGGTCEARTAEIRARRLRKPPHSESQLQTR